MSEIVFDREKLKEDGYCPVGIDLGFSDYEEAIKRYQAFLELDELYHEATRYWVDPNRGFDFGQFTRIAGTHGDRGKIQDNKDIFHYGAQTRQVIEARLRGDIPSDMRLFLEAAEEIFWNAQSAKVRALDSLDHRHTGLVGLSLPESGVITDPVRFILYYPSPDGMLAKSHFDRSFATLALSESHEGLRITPGQNGLRVNADSEYLANLESNLANVTYTEGQAKFFLGAGWNRIPEQYREGNEDLRLGWHDVIKSDKTVDEQVMRWAIINFINPAMDYYDQYAIPTPPETRPYKQLGWLTTPTPDLLHA